jgi:nicotinamide phosphoribosyltransferase
MRGMSGVHDAMRCGVGHLLFVTANGLHITEAERQGSVQVRWEIYGGTLTDNHYRMVNDKVGLIHGDSISLPRALDILTRLCNRLAGQDLALQFSGVSWNCPQPSAAASAPYSISGFA